MEKIYIHLIINEYIIYYSLNSIYKNEMQLKMLCFCCFDFVKVIFDCINILLFAKNFNVSFIIVSTVQHNKSQI